MSTEKQKIIIGSRGSDLALWQAHFVEKKLTDLGHLVELKIIKTKGDKITNVSFDKIEGKGFFTKELEAELLNGSIDLAVHSYKDSPTEDPDGLCICASSYRESPIDCLVIDKAAFDESQIFSLKKNALVGTSAPRRIAELMHHRPDLDFKAIRGNVPTRLGKTGNEVDAVVLADAGLSRLQLDLSKYEVIRLDPTKVVPAPAQGVLAYQTRIDDENLKNILQNINDEAVAECVNVERSILKNLEGGCQKPVGVYCIKEDGLFKVWASYAMMPEGDANLVDKLRKVNLMKIFQSNENPVALIENTLKFYEYV